MVSLTSLHDDQFLLIFLFAGIPSAVQLSLCSLYYNTRFYKDNNEIFWESLYSHTSVLYQSSLLHRVCFPVDFVLCDEDISQILPMVETPTTWKEYFFTAISKLDWLCKIQKNCTMLQTLYTMSTEQSSVPLMNCIFSLNDIILIRHHANESDSFQSLYSYENIEMLRLRSQSRHVHTTSSGCVVEELTYRLDSHDTDAAAQIPIPPVSLCVLSAMNGSIFVRDVVEGVLDRHFLLGMPCVTPEGKRKLKVESCFRREMPFELYYLEQEV